MTRTLERQLWRQNWSANQILFHAFEDYEKWLALCIHIVCTQNAEKEEEEFKLSYVFKILEEQNVFDCFIQPRSLLV